jgi:hypothetical protein
MGLFTILAIVLGLWGVITLVRRIAEVERHRVERGALRGRADDETDYDELRRAEEEVRDLDGNARPEDGFEGDDWGPGAARKPPQF